MADTTAAVVTPAQNPLTLVMKIKSPESLAALQQLMPAAQQPFADALDTMGTAHFTRLALLKDGTGALTRLAYIATYDGLLYDFVNRLVDTSGELLDRLFEHISGAPPLPVCENRAELLQFAQAHDVPAPVWYSAYPTLSVQNVKANAGPQPAPDPAQPPVQLPLASIMVINSPAAAAKLKELMAGSLPLVLKALGAIGTVHFGRFLFLENGTQFAIVTDFDGPFDAYIRAFVKFLGPVFDSMLGLVNGGAGLVPVVQHTDDFLTFVNATDAKPGAWYSAYPTLTVQNILAQSGQP